MIINADTERDTIMETKSLNFDEIVSQYTTLRYRAYFYIPGYDYIYTDWYYNKSGLDALQSLCEIVHKSDVVEDTTGYIQSQRVVVAKVVRLDGDIENA